MRKNFIAQIRTGFACLRCKEINNDQNPSPRNHCAFCLYSLHVDREVPGDRLSTCLGLMRPVSIEYSGKKGYIIIHSCEKCGKKIKNKTAEDDNYDLIVALTTRGNIV